MWSDLSTLESVNLGLTNPDLTSRHSESIRSAFLASRKEFRSELFPDC